MRWGCLKSWLLFRHPRELKIKSLYINDLIFNIASTSKETVKKLKFLDSPLSTYSKTQLSNRSSIQSSYNRPIFKTDFLSSFLFLLLYFYLLKLQKPPLYTRKLSLMAEKNHRIQQEPVVKHSRLISKELSNRNLCTGSCHCLFNLLSFFFRNILL